MISFAVGPCEMGAARARHALSELALMAGLPRAAGEPAVTVAYGRAAESAPGRRVVVPHVTPHVPRDVTPEMYHDGGVDVPVMYPAAVPDGDVLVAAGEGHPLVVRAPDAVYLGFDVARAADYYLNGRGEVGWTRDGDGRPLVEAGPPWRVETAGVAVVNRYASILARACEAAIAAEPYPLIRFRWWPGGAPFALALSHDVDRVRAPRRREVLRAMLRRRRAGGPHAAYTPADLLRGAAPLKPLPALFAAEEAAGGVSTFFIGARRLGPLDYDYDGDEVAPLAREVARAGREVALHSSYYTVADGAALRQERDALAERAGVAVVGVRGHYLRLAGDHAWSAVGEAGVAYDASFGYPGHVGWRGGAALPWQPFPAADDEPYDFRLVPLAVMDGTLFQYLLLDAEAAFARARALVDEAAAVGGVATLNWHYRAFKGGVFPTWGPVFKRLVEYAVTKGGVPMTHAAVAARHRFNTGIDVRRRPDGDYELTMPGGGADVVFAVPEGWSVAAAAGARTAGGRDLVIPAGGRTATVRLIRKA